MNNKTTDMDITMKKLYLVDILTTLICFRLEWSWSDKDNALINVDGQVIEWDDFDSVPIDLEGFIQVNFWGDGTIELQEDNGESINIYKYDLSVLESVVEVLKRMVKVQ